MMIAKKLVAAAMLAAFPAMLAAQEEGTQDDLGLWLSASVEKKFGKKWSVEAEGEFRMRDDVSAAERFSLGVSGTYKIKKWLKADAGYDILDNRKAGGETESGKYYNSTCWYVRHRVHASLSESFKVGRLKVALRERWVYTYSPEYERHRMDLRTASGTYGEILGKTRNGRCENTLRTRLAVEYNVPKSKFTPYVSAEAYMPLGQDVDFGTIQKMRYTAGTEYRFTKHHTAKFFYTFQDRTHIGGDDDVCDSHVLGAGYSYSF